MEPPAAADSRRWRARARAGRAPAGAWGGRRSHAHADPHASGRGGRRRRCAVLCLLHREHCCRELLRGRRAGVGSGRRGGWSGREAAAAGAGRGVRAHGRALPCAPAAAGRKGGRRPDGGRAPLRRDSEGEGSCLAETRAGRGEAGGTGEGRWCGLCSRRPRGLLLGLGFAIGLDGMNVWLCINFGSFGLTENRTELTE